MEERKNYILKRIFPEYFNQFELPSGAKEESIIVYRACRSGRCDKASFLPTYEERGFSLSISDDPRDPGVYSLSTYEKPKDIKRFAVMTSDMKVPYQIAIGSTDPVYGLVQRTKDRAVDAKARKRARSHVDWWLYQDAAPYEVFELIPDFEQYFEEYKRKETVHG